MARGCGLAGSFRPTSIVRLPKGQPSVQVYKKISLLGSAPANCVYQSPFHLFWTQKNSFERFSDFSFIFVKLKLSLALIFLSFLNYLLRCLGCYTVKIAFWHLRSGFKKLRIIRFLLIFYTKDRCFEKQLDLKVDQFLSSNWSSKQMKQACDQQGQPKSQVVD